MAARLKMADLVDKLQLQPHPEGGFFSETFRDTSVSVPLDGLPAGYKVGRQAVSTAIYFLVPSGAISKLHRIPSAEVWHFYYGDPLTVVEIDQEGALKKTVLGHDLLAGQAVQHVVPPGVWFGSYPTLDFDPVDGSKVTKERDPQESFSLVGCTVAPAFEFADFEMGSRASLLEKYSQHKKEIELLAE